MLLMSTLLLVYLFPGLYTPSLSAQRKGPFRLDKTEVVSTSTESEFYVKAPTSTVQFFVYLSPMQRTPVKHTCGTAPNQPSCENGRFPICTCINTDCSMCTHEGYYDLINILGIARLELLTIPDASRQKQSAVQLVVRTESASPGSTVRQNSIETMALPPIPYQKWTMITIAREGRRFDIYYDDSLVISFTTTNPIATFIPDTRGVVMGNSQILGQAGYYFLHSRLMRAGDVSTMYKQYTDTRGRPFLPVPEDPTMNLSGVFPSVSLGSPDLTMPNFSLCPSGSCTNAPTGRPATPWLDWNSDYA
jgi:hypothetical protein